jgi:hypothetical protein
MRCQDAATRVVELIDGGEPAERGGELLDHLETCGACATEFAAYRGLVALLRADVIPEPPPRFWEEFVPALRRRIDREFPVVQSRAARWLTLVRSWVVLPRPLMAGVAVAALLALLVIRPGLLPMSGDRFGIRQPSVERLAGPAVDPAGLSDAGWLAGGGELVVVAGEFVDDPGSLAAAIVHLPGMDEIVDRLEEAWVWRAESDPGDWVVSLSEEDQQVVLDRLREYRWSPS